jgi:hypothetical protein
MLNIEVGSKNYLLFLWQCYKILLLLEMMANIAADLTVVSARDPSFQLFITSYVEVTSLLRRRVVSLTDEAFERCLLNREER